MKKKYFLITSLLLLFAVACTRENDVLEEQIEQNQTSKFEYLAGYMFYNNSADGSSKITIDFTNSKPTRRNLSLNSGNPVGGSGSINNGDLYETLTYNGNIITVLQKTTNPNGFVPERKRELTLSNEKLIKKVDFNEFNEVANQTDYLYNGDQLKIVSYYKANIGGGLYLKSKSEIFYNANINVDSIVTRNAEYDYVSDMYIYNAATLKREIEVFSGFDQTANPVKNLGIFDELFYRSLSQNNFTIYKKTIYDEVGSLIAVQSQKSWNFVYENGKINFAK